MRRKMVRTLMVPFQVLGALLAIWAPLWSVRVVFTQNNFFTNARVPANVWRVGDLVVVFARPLKQPDWHPTTKVVVQHEQHVHADCTLRSLNKAL